MDSKLNQSIFSLHFCSNIVPPELSIGSKGPKGPRGDSGESFNEYRGPSYSPVVRKGLFYQIFIRSISHLIDQLVQKHLEYNKITLSE